MGHRQSKPVTLNCVLEQLKSNDHLTKSQKSAMASAVKAVAKILNSPPSGVPIDIPSFRVTSEKGQPGRLGITPKRFSNIRSAFAQALIESNVDLEPLRLTAALSEEWACLDAMISKQPDRRVLIRFMRWCSWTGVPPSAVTQETIDQYYDRVANHSLLSKADAKFQMLVKRWNEYATKVPAWPKVQLSGLNRAKGFQIPHEDFPESFREDLQDFYKFLIADDVLQIRTLPPQRLVSAQKRVENLSEAAEALRTLIDTVVLTPSEDGYDIDLHGDLAGILALATGKKAKTAKADMAEAVSQVSLVAGAGFGLCRTTEILKVPRQTSCQSWQKQSDQKNLA